MGDGPIGVTNADFDGKNGADLAASNSFSNNVSVLLNTTTPGPPPDKHKKHKKHKHHKKHHKKGKGGKGGGAHQNF